MAYRIDPDLEFLAKLTSEELKPLVHVLVYDKDNKKRLTEQITSNDKYKQFQPDHSKYWDIIAEEIQRFGGNTFINIVRAGKGVLYREILMDVCDKAKVNYNKKSSIEQIESNLLQKIFLDAVEKMNTEELKTIVTELNLETTNFTPQAVVAALQLALRNSMFLWGDVVVIVFQSMIARMITAGGIVFTGNIIGTRLLAAFTGPISWAITGLWTAFDIAGPAYRVTVPAVIMTACLRQMHK